MNQSPDARRWTKGTKCASKSTGLCCPEIARSESTALSRTTVSSTVAKDSKGGCNKIQTPCPVVTNHSSLCRHADETTGYHHCHFDVICQILIIYSAFIRGFTKNGNTMENAQTINRLSCLMNRAQDKITTHRYVINQFIKNPTRCNSVSYFISPYLYEAQHVLGNKPPTIRSLKLHQQPLVFHTWKVDRCVLVGCWQSSASTRPTTFHVWKTRGC